MVEQKICTKCGVVLCEKNWHYHISSGKSKNRNLASTCRHCYRNFTSCRYNYEDKELHKLSRKNANSISANLQYRNNSNYRERRKAIVPNLSDDYVKSRLNRSMGFKSSEISQELIQIKREQLKLKRLKKQWKSLTNKEKLQLKV